MRSEPPWPDLVLPLEDDLLLNPSSGGSLAPFIGSGASPARMNRLFSPVQEDLTAPVTRRAAMAFLKARLHIDLTHYPEYRGGVVLIAPDPIAREVRMFVRPRPGDNDAREDIVVHVLPRMGADLTALELTLVEMRGGGLHRFERTALPASGLISWENRHQAAMAGFVLTHATQASLDIRSQPLPATGLHWRSASLHVGFQFNPQQAIRPALGMRRIM